MTQSGEKAAGSRSKSDSLDNERVADVPRKRYLETAELLGKLANPNRTTDDNPDAL